MPPKEPVTAPPQAAGLDLASERVLPAGGRLVEGRNA